MNEKSPIPKPISAEEFDAKFDAGEDISEHLDWDNARWVPPAHVEDACAQWWDAVRNDACWSGAFAGVAWADLSRDAQHEVLSVYLKARPVAAAA